nr:13141_t:CDS:2 [Entrophospora candida]
MSTNDNDNSEAAIYAERLRARRRLIMRVVRERESKEHRRHRLQLLRGRKKNERIINATTSIDTPTYTSFASFHWEDGETIVLHDIEINNKYKH